MNSTTILLLASGIGVFLTGAGGCSSHSPPSGPANIMAEGDGATGTSDGSDGVRSGNESGVPAADIPEGGLADAATFVGADAPADQGPDAGVAVDTGVPAPGDIDIYLIGGQSNATGQGYTKNIPPSFIVNTNVRLYHSADIISGAPPNTWIALRNASEAPDSAGARFGPELGFGNEIQSLYPSRTIGIIKHAKSGTNLVQQWAPGSNAADVANFGPEFKTFVATVDGGLQALRDKGMHPVIRAMLWQQGEADAGMGAPAAQQYGQHLVALIARVREQWSTPAMMFVYGYVYPKSNFGAGRDAVRLAEANVDQDSGNALATKGAFVVVTDDLELRASDPGTPYPTDLVHFGTAGQLELGKRMATKVHDKLPL